MNEMITTTGRSIGTITTEIRTITRQTQQMVLSAAIEIGRRLMEAKELVPHGEWGEYLQREVEFSQSTANNFMQIYKEYGTDQQSLFGANAQAMAGLNYTKALRLLALPAEDREEFLESHNVEDMSTRELEKAIRERDAAQQAAEEAKDEAKYFVEEAGKVRDQLKQQQRLTEEAKAKAAAAEKKAADVSRLEAELKQAKAAANEAKKELKALRENPQVPEAVLEAMRKEAELQAAETVRKQVEGELNAAQDALAKARQDLEAAQKAQRLADPDLMAVQALGQQIMAIWNTVLGHKKKTAMNHPENEAPLDSFLKMLLEKMGEGL